MLSRSYDASHVAALILEVWFSARCFNENWRSSQKYDKEDPPRSELSTENVGNLRNPCIIPNTVTVTLVALPWPARSASQFCWGRWVKATHRHRVSVKTAVFADDFFCRNHIYPNWIRTFYLSLKKHSDTTNHAIMSSYVWESVAIYGCIWYKYYILYIYKL